MNITITDQVTLIAFWLAFTRWLGIMLQLPLFDNLAIPAPVKALGTLVITYAFFPYVSPHIMQDINYMGQDSFVLLTAFYLLSGRFS